jgi:signal transduction histidine kinase
VIIGEFRILLIDDDEDDFVNLRDLFREIQGSKYTLTWKSNYSEGLKALQGENFDVCLLDHRLGEHTGMELLKEVQKNGLPCPIIFLTGFGDFELDVQAMQMGASEYLVKSQLTPPLLERTIRYTMKHAFDMQQIHESRTQILQQDRLASLGLLASSLAHEIGTPLGIIRSRSEMTAKKSADEKVKSDMNVVITQIDRIAKLVNSLLNLAREKKSDYGAAIDLKLVLDDVVTLLQPELKHQNIELQLHIPDGVFVIAESGPLAQVILNLMVNSIHAIADAKDRDHHLISVGVESKGSHVEVKISDTGAGIAEKNLSQLFKPFFTTKAIGQGTGLGLATSYKLVQSWKGSMKVESTEGKGTVFTICLQSAAKA